MGDRVSIAFVNESNTYQPTSVALFDHWGGEELPAEAKRYAEELIAEITAKGDTISQPLDRLEPNTVMLDFIRWLGSEGAFDGRVWSRFYLGKDENDGDNSDNGHFEIVVTTDGVTVRGGRS